MHADGPAKKTSNAVVIMSDLFATPDIAVRTARRIGACAASDSFANASGGGEGGPDLASGLAASRSTLLCRPTGSTAGGTTAAPQVHTTVLAASADGERVHGAAQLYALVEGGSGTIQGGSRQVGLTMGSSNTGSIVGRAQQLALLRAPAPTREALRAALGPPKRLNAEVWRGSPSLRRTHWLCPNCKEVNPNSCHDCKGCGAAYAVFSSGATQAEVDAIAEDAQASEYGQRLLFIGGSVQVEGEAVAALPGTPGYAAAVFNRISQQGERRLVICV
jgi:hypothetical protein